MTIELIRWIAAVVLACGAGVLSAANWYALVKSMTPKGGPSWIPLIGGLLGLLAMLVVPVKTGVAFLWIPLVVDGGSVPGLLATLAFWVRRRRRPRGHRQAPEDK
jgi:hypothetical protein